MRYNCASNAYARPFAEASEKKDGTETEAQQPRRSSQGPANFSQVYKTDWTSMASKWKNVARKVRRLIHIDVSNATVMSFGRFSPDVLG